MTHACYIVLLVAHTAPYVIIAWSDLITIALGWANALEWYVFWDVRNSPSFSTFCFIYLSFYGKFFSFMVFLLIQLKI